MVSSSGEADESEDEGVEESLAQDDAEVSIDDMTTSDDDITGTVAVNRRSREDDDGDDVAADLDYVPFTKPWNELSRAEMLREVQVDHFRDT